MRQQFELYIYVPTGLAVKCDSKRTQLENKKLAEERLRLKLTALDDERENKERKIMWDGFSYFIRAWKSHKNNKRMFRLKHKITGLYIQPKPTFTLSEVGKIYLKKSNILKCHKDLTNGALD